MKLAIASAILLMLICSPVIAQEHDPQRIVNQFMSAWDASDPKAISNLFAPDADLIAPDGVTAHGRSAIQAYYAAAFARGYAGSKGVGQIVQQRPISTDLVLLDSHFSIVGARKADGSPEPDEKGAMAVVLRRVSNDWQIVALRERSGDTFTPFPADRR